MSEALEALKKNEKMILGMIQGCEEDEKEEIEEATIIKEALQQLYESMDYSPLGESK